MVPFGLIPSDGFTGDEAKDRRIKHSYHTQGRNTKNLLPSALPATPPINQLIRLDACMHACITTSTMHLCIHLTLHSYVML